MTEEYSVLTDEGFVCLPYTAEPQRQIKRLFVGLEGKNVHLTIIQLFLLQKQVKEILN